MKKLFNAVAGVFTIGAGAGLLMIGETGFAHGHGNIAAGCEIGGLLIGVVGGALIGRAVGKLGRRSSSGEDGGNPPLPSNPAP